MSFGLTWEKILLILVIAALVIGPERLPRYAEMLGSTVRRARTWLQDAKTRVKDDMGEDFDDVDWKKLDPRQYDPRRIIRDALLDDPVVPTSPGPAAQRPVPTAPITRRTFSADEPPPYDAEAT